MTMVRVMRCFQVELCALASQQTLCFGCFKREIGGKTSSKFAGGSICSALKMEETEMIFLVATRNRKVLSPGRLKPSRCVF